ncbi:MAG: hypothetical protein CL955_06820 [Erythrobacteraceae bacterium]|nr:hypothetical protein [Erythrobacteraceae bacterium]
MTASAKNTFGAVLKIDDTGGTPAEVAELTNITPPAMSRSTIDVTTHDGASQAMEFIPDGVYDPGEISLEGNLIASSTEDDQLISALTTGTVQDFEILIKAASGTDTWSGSAILTDYTPGPMPVSGGKQTFTATLKVTGPITVATTA